MAELKDCILGNAYKQILDSLYDDIIKFVPDKKPGVQYGDLFFVSRDLLPLDTIEYIICYKDLDFEIIHLETGEYGIFGSTKHLHRMIQDLFRQIKSPDVRANQNSLR